MRVLARSLIGWLIEPLAAVLLVACATTAIAQPFYIPSGSMEPTLQIGDTLLGTKFAYGYSRWSLPYGLGPSSRTRLFGKLPARGDVVIFRRAIAQIMGRVKAEFLADFHHRSRATKR